jgi:putative oxidoreductase
MDKINAALVVLRVSVGCSMAYHGLNKTKNFAGTSSWFTSIGMKWPKKQALAAVLTEIVGGLGLAMGLVTPLTLTSVIALMVVAILTVHRRVGYFIFLPNGGWEYCASIIAVCTALSLTGPGAWSVDSAIGVDPSINQWALPVGIIAAVCHLALCWRPPSRNVTP